ncbi:MAG: ester cyclase [Actinomycetota bacterium]
MSNEDNKGLYRRWLLGMWNGDADEAAAIASEIAAPHLVVHQARAGRDESKTPRGPDALVQIVTQGRAPFDEVKVSIEVGPVAEGDLVSARWEFAGSYNGGIPGATAAAGTLVAFAGIDLFRIENGKLAEYWVSSDDGYLMAQLGM